MKIMLSHKKNEQLQLLKGFGFTVQISEKRQLRGVPISMFCHLLYTQELMYADMDPVKQLTKEISNAIFGVEEYETNVVELEVFRQQFTELGFEVEVADVLNTKYYWFRVACNLDTISEKVNIISNKLKILS